MLSFWGVVLAGVVIVGTTAAIGGILVAPTAALLRAADYILGTGTCCPKNVAIVALLLTAVAVCYVIDSILAAYNG